MYIPGGCRQRPPQYAVFLISCHVLQAQKVIECCYGLLVYGSGFMVYWHGMSLCMGLSVQKKEEKPWTRSLERIMRLHHDPPPWTKGISLRVWWFVPLGIVSGFPGE